MTQVAARGAGVYGIRPSYCVLAHLRWAIQPENATATADCLELLGEKLRPLKEAEAAGELLPQVGVSTASQQTGSLGPASIRQRAAALPGTCKPSLVSAAPEVDAFSRPPTLHCRMQQ